MSAGTILFYKCIMFCVVRKPSVLWILFSTKTSLTLYSGLPISMVIHAPSQKRRSTHFHEYLMVFRLFFDRVKMFVEQLISYLFGLTVGLNIWQKLFAFLICMWILRVTLNPGKVNIPSKAGWRLCSPYIPGGLDLPSQPEDNFSFKNNLSRQFNSKVVAIFLCSI